MTIDNDYDRVLKIGKAHNNFEAVMVIVIGLCANSLFHNTFRNSLAFSGDTDKIDATVQVTHVDDG